MQYFRTTSYGLRKLATWIKTKYNTPVLHVIDNGVGDCGTIYDEARIQHIKDNVATIEKSACTILYSDFRFLGFKQNVH